MQIHRLTCKRRIAMNHHRTGIHQRRVRYLTDIDLTEESGLADIDRHSDVGRHDRRGDKESSQ